MDKIQMMQRIDAPHKILFANSCRRPGMPEAELDEVVGNILREVQRNGDVALRRYTKEFDGVALPSLVVPRSAIEASGTVISAELREAIKTAAGNISHFHESQREAEQFVTTMPGVTCWRTSVAIDSVGLYVPGGSAPLLSSVLMLGIPAAIAGCEQISLCTPPQPDGSVHPAILYAAYVSGIKQVYAVGGAQAIAALAYGTDSIPRAYKIFGPGNQYVTRAKQLVAAAGIAIDIPAGPTELAIVADEGASPAAIAADILSQAEHGPDSQVVLFSMLPTLLDAVEVELGLQLKTLPRRDIATAALSNSLSVLCTSEAHMLELVNEYAPEHLILAISEPRSMASKVRNAGSVFLGYCTPESVGDYASGTNHTLPTNGAARAYSGVSLESFQKKITFQELDPQGLRGIARTVMTMASAEGLEGHARAVAVRLGELDEEY